ncbi:MAG: DUF429 domain-containing protein [Polyangiales bacterium]|nr:DUF429 domain-containing protein [Sandaracinaceae bacterium]
MTTILALDAAWTATEPSGVALVTRDAARWRVVAAAPSYNSFLGLAEGTPIQWAAERFTGCDANVPKLLAASAKLAGVEVDLVTIDMPVSLNAFTGRREADNAISREFGSRGCAAHSPSVARPGKLGESLSAAFRNAGYRVAGADTQVSTPRRLLEVYPHPALLALLECSYRVQYKVSKSTRYWPREPLRQRIAYLLHEFARIHEALHQALGPIGVPLPAADDVPSLNSLKRYEDVLDALVCAWVGVRYMEGGARPLGDEAAAIWCPSSRA